MSNALKKLAAAAGYGRDRWTTTEDFEAFLDNYGQAILRRAISVINNSDLSWDDQCELVEELEHSFGLQLQEPNDEPASKPQPKFVAGDRVYVGPNKMEATVIQQIKHYDGSEVFWGNVELLYDDGVKGISNCWQLQKL